MDWECRLAGTKFRSIDALLPPRNSKHIYEIAHNKHPEREMPMPLVVVAACWLLLELHNKPARLDHCFVPSSGYRRYS